MKKNFKNFLKPRPVQFAVLEFRSKYGLSLYDRDNIRWTIPAEQLFISLYNKALCLFCEKYLVLYRGKYHEKF